MSPPSYFPVQSCHRNSWRVSFQQWGREGRKKQFSHTAPPREPAHQSSGDGYGEGRGGGGAEPAPGEGEKNIRRRPSEMSKYSSGLLSRDVCGRLTSQPASGGGALVRGGFVMCMLRLFMCTSSLDLNFLFFFFFGFSLFPPVSFAKANGAAGGETEYW